MILSDKICSPHHTRSLFCRGPTPCFKGVKSLKEQNICSTQNLLQSSIDSIPYGIQSSSQMIGGSNHLRNAYYLGSNYHSQVIGSLKCIKFRVYKLEIFPFGLILHLDWSYRNPEGWPSGSMVHAWVKNTRNNYSTFIEKLGNGSIYMPCLVGALYIFIYIYIYIYVMHIYIIYWEDALPNCPNRAGPNCPRRSPDLSELMQSSRKHPIVAP